MNNFDIDIDLADRDLLLSKIRHVPAMIDKNGKLTKHNTGIYANPIPSDPLSDISNIDYLEAERLGYMKLDLLNVHIYEQIKNEEDLMRLLDIEPMWEMLKYREFVEKVIHINNHFDIMSRMPEPIDSIPRLMMFLAIIRPAKRYLIGKLWKEVAKEVWLKPADGSYAYKKSHGCAYAHLVVVHMNLLCGF